MWKYLNKELTIEKNDDLKLCDSESEITFLIEHFEERVYVIKRVTDKLEAESKKSDNNNGAESEEAKQLKKINFKDCKDIVSKRFDRLKQLLKKERITNISPQLRTAQREAKKENYKKSIESLTKGLNIIRPFNVNKVLTMYNNCDYICQSLKNKDVVLFLGNSGVGKSTLISYLKGVEFEQDKQYKLHLQPKNRDVIENSNNNNKDLKNIKLSFRPGNSITNFIASVSIDRGDNDAADNKNNSNRVLVCDTPGFGDTEGDEVEVGNWLCLLACMRAVNSFSIVLAISHDDITSKMRLFKQASDKIQVLFKNIDHNKKNSNIMNNSEDKAGDEKKDDDSKDENSTDDSGMQ